MKNIKALILILAITPLASCATYTILPNNQAFIDCSGTGNLGDCYNKANDICPRGYEILDRVNETHTGLLSTTHTTNITIKC